MSWIEKNTPTPFDEQPVTGLFYLNGDALGRRFHRHWVDGHKLAMIAFPSGEERELWPSSDPERYGAVVHLFGEMDLPLYDTQQGAWERANDISNQCGYLAVRRGEDTIELYGRETDDHFLIVYDNDERLMVDVVRGETP